MKGRQLRIGVTCYATYGGSGIIAAEIGMQMARRGHRVHFICHDVPRRLMRFTDNIFFHEVEVQDYPVFPFRPYSIGLASKMVEVTTYEKLDLLHVHYAVPHATSAFLASQVLGEHRPKVITTLHGTDITLVGTERSYLPITRFSIEKSDGVTAPSQYLKYATYDKLNVSTDTPIEVIGNFVDSEKYSPIAAKDRAVIRSHLGLCQNDANKLITHASNFRAVKRIPDVIRVFAAVRKSVNAQLVLIGDGPERSNAEQLARSLGVSDQVCFLGKQDAFVEILQNSDLFLMPSETESFGLASLEAMSCGVPVISTNAGGIPEVISHGESGYLADIGDVESLTNFSVKLLTDEKLHRQFAQAARQRVLEQFSAVKTIDAYENYYYKICGE